MSQSTEAPKVLELNVWRSCRSPEESATLGLSLRLKESVSVSLSLGLNECRMEADRLGKALKSVWPVELSEVNPEVADTLPWVLAVFIRIVEPGDRVVRQLVCLPRGRVAR